MRLPGGWYIGEDPPLLTPADVKPTLALARNSETAAERLRADVDAVRADRELEAELEGLVRRGRKTAFPTVIDEFPDLLRGPGLTPQVARVEEFGRDE